MKKLLVSKFLSRPAEIYKTIIDDVQMWSLNTQKEERELLLMETNVLRKILGPIRRGDGPERGQKNREISKLVYILWPNIVGERKSHRLRKLGHVLQMEEDRAAKWALLGVPVSRRPVGGRTSWTLQIFAPDWMEVPQERNRWQYIAKAHFGVAAPG